MRRHGFKIATALLVLNLAACIGSMAATSPLVMMIAVFAFIPLAWFHGYAAAGASIRIRSPFTVAGASSQASKPKRNVTPDEIRALQRRRGKGA